MIKLSFIVPVYNVEQYLRKCVESLIKQDLSRYEIILVDDGSTDNSSKICDEYVGAFEIGDCKLEIKCIHQANAGLSAARNAGLKMAKGEYVCFVDSDDYWEENVLGGLMEQVAMEQLDVLRFDYQNVRLVESGESRVKSRYEVFEPNKTPRYIDTGNEVVDGETYLNTRMRYACYAWQFIIHKNIVNTFTRGIHFEDVDWLPRMVLNAKRMNSTTTMVYNYLVRQGSITKTQGDKEKIRKNIDDRLLIIDKYRQYIEQYPKCQWLKNMQSTMVAGVLTNVALEFYSEREKYTKRLIDYHVFPLSVAEQGCTYGRKARVINAFGPQIYCAIMHLIK